MRIDFQDLDISPPPALIFATPRNFFPRHFPIKKFTSSDIPRTPPPPPNIPAYHKCSPYDNINYQIDVKFNTSLLHRKHISIQHEQLFNQTES